MEPIEGSYGREAIKAMTFASADEMKNMDSSEIMKESAMEELESNASGSDDEEVIKVMTIATTDVMKRKAYSSEVMKVTKESTMKELETIASMRNLVSSNVVKEGKLTSNDATWREDMYPLARQQDKRSRYLCLGRSKCHCGDSISRRDFILVCKPIQKRCSICRRAMKRQGRLSLKN